MRLSKQLTIFPVILALASLLQSADPTLSDKFYNAIRADNKPAVAQLLKDGADVNTRDTRGATPLMYAAAVGSPDMMRQILAAGADVNAKNNFEATALLWCTNNLEKVRLLIDKGANVNAVSKSGRTPVRVAAAHSGNVEVVRLLLNKGADLTKPKEAGAEALVAAASANDAATIKLLLDRGVDANSRDSGGFTALMVAAERRNVEVVKWLLARGAPMSMRSPIRLPRGRLRTVSSRSVV